MVARSVSMKPSRAKTVLPVVKAVVGMVVDAIAAIAKVDILNVVPAATATGVDLNGPPLRRPA